MIKRLNNILLPILCCYICTRSNLLYNNISGLANNMRYYLLSILIGISIAINYYDIISKIISKNIAKIIIIICILPMLFPYNNNIIIRNIHIFISYVSFAVLSITIYHCIKIFNNLSAIKIYHLMMMTIIIIFLKTLVINNLIEMIYILGIWLISNLLNNDNIKNSTY